MDEAESVELVGRQGDPAVARFLAQARGWPAVLALAATPLAPRLPTGEAVPAELHRYLAEELYQSGTTSLRAQLVELALLPNLSRTSLEARFGADATGVLAAARTLGFVSTGDEAELHPLLREFLLQKLHEDPRAAARVRLAVAGCILAESWDQALELVLRFGLFDLVEPILESAYKPLLRAGRLGTLSHFANRLGSRPTFSAPGVELIDAEVALRDGAYALASDLALRVRRKLPVQHALRSRASAIVGNCGFMLADFVVSEEAFRFALADAIDERDEADALFGLALAPIFDERPNIAPSVAALAARRERSPVDLVRHAGIVLGVSRIGPGFSRLDAFEEAMHALPHVEDPLVRTGFTANYSYALGIQAKYEAAFEVACLLRDDVEAFDLEFARPHAQWNLAFACLGLRRFGEAERHLQLVEDSVKHRHDGHHALNARVLRARMLLQLAQPEEALEYVRFDTHEAAAPSMQAEYLATRALVLACLGRTADASAAAGPGRAAIGLVRGPGLRGRRAVDPRREQPGSSRSETCRRACTAAPGLRSTPRRASLQPASGRSAGGAGRDPADPRAPLRGVERPRPFPSRRDPHQVWTDAVGDPVAARVRGARADGAWPEEQGDRRGARHRGVDDQGARPACLREARRTNPHRGGGALPDVLSRVQPTASFRGAKSSVRSVKRSSNDSPRAHR